MDNFGPHIGRYPDGTAKMAICVCPVCRKRLDAASSATGSKALPLPGDIIICIGCAAILEFGPGLAVVRLSAATQASLPLLMQRHILDTVRMVQLIHAQEQEKND